jgi:hypothetical protein
MTSLEQVFNGTTSVEFTYGFNGVHQEISRSVTDGTYLWEPDASDTTVYGVANGVNEYPSVAGTAFSYDGNGNLTSDGTLTNTFDTENHLTAASKTGTAVSYLYDGSHRQIQRTVTNSTKSRYVYRRFQRIADFDGTSGDLQTRYVYGVGLDEPLIAVASDGTLTYLHADRLGSLIATTNSGGDVSNQHSTFFASRVLKSKAKEPVEDRLLALAELSIVQLLSATGSQVCRLRERAIDNGRGLDCPLIFDRLFDGAIDHRRFLNRAVIQNRLLIPALNKNRTIVGALNHC